MDILDILDVEILDHFYIKDIKDIHYYFTHIKDIMIWLVVEPPLWKIWKSMGRMTSHTTWKIKVMFETTNQ